MQIELMPATLASAEIEDLSAAVRLLEGESFAARLTGVMGRQIASLGRMLPSPARRTFGSPVKIFLTRSGSLTTTIGSSAAIRIVKTSP